MYVTEKDLEVMRQVTAFIDGALESADGVDEQGDNIQDYWIRFSNEANRLEFKMQRANARQSIVKTK